MDSSNNINPITGFPYKTTLKERLSALKYRKKIYADPVLREKRRQYRYNQWRRSPTEKKRVREYMRKYNMSPKRIYEILKANADKRKIPVIFSVNEFISWWNSIPNICFYCDRELETAKDFFRKEIGRLTVDRIDNNKGYALTNIAKSCWLCNRIKADIFTKDEMLEIGKVIATLKRFNQSKINNE